MDTQQTVKMLRVPEVAERLGYSTQHVYNLIWSGKLEATRLTERGHWRIRSDVLEAFIDAGQSSTDTTS